MSKKLKLKPFVKWAGGKTQLWPFLKVVMNVKYKTYFEPFLGGGSSFLSLTPQKAVLSDINEELISAWHTLKSQPQEVVSLLKTYIQRLKLEKKDFYYQLREQKISSLDNISKTARFIFLNKTCFNGLYRVNSKNQFNTPFNGNIDICLSTIINESNLKNITSFLNKNEIQIHCQDYKKTIAQAEVDDLLFCDPPYDSDTQTFNNYNASPFDQTNQKDLCEVLKSADLKGVKWILTNHDTNLINNLYKDFNFIKIPVDRFINSQSSNRKNNTYETIITNFKLRDEQTKEINNLLFFKELKTTSYFLKDYVSWEKINQFINQNKKIIQKWNNLKSKTEQEFFDKFELQWQESPTNFEFLPILLANNRFLQNEKVIFFNNFNQEIEFAHQNKEVVINFIKESKLLTNVFLNSNFNQNIKDYLLGVLVGLDSNSRKNKSGRFLPTLIKTLFKKHNFNFQEEILLTDILKGVELKETKRVDFVFQHNNTTYLLECSFFNNSGSKINSELKRLVEFDNIINKFKNFRFIYVIDGPGLKKNAILVDKILTETNILFNIHRFQEFLKTIKQN